SPWASSIHRYVCPYVVGRVTEACPAPFCSATLVSLSDSAPSENAYTCSVAEYPVAAVPISSIAWTSKVNVRVESGRRTALEPRSVGLEMVTTSDCGPEMPGSWSTQPARASAPAATMSARLLERGQDAAFMCFHFFVEAG